MADTRRKDAARFRATARGNTAAELGSSGIRRADLRSSENEPAVSPSPCLSACDTGDVSPDSRKLLPAHISRKLVQLRLNLESMLSDSMGELRAEVSASEGRVVSRLEREHDERLATMKVQLEEHLEGRVAEICTAIFKREFDVNLLKAGNRDDRLAKLEACVKRVGTVERSTKDILPISGKMHLDSLEKWTRDMSAIPTDVTDMMDVPCISLPLDTQNGLSSVATDIDSPEIASPSSLRSFKLTTGDSFVSMPVCCDTGSLNDAVSSKSSSVDSDSSSDSDESAADESVGCPQDVQACISELKTEIHDLKTSSVELQSKLSARLEALEDDIRLSTSLSPCGQVDVVKAACGQATGESGTLKPGAHSSDSRDLSHGAFTLENSTTVLQAEERVELRYDGDIAESVAKALSSCSEDFIKRLNEECSARQEADAFFEMWIKRIERYVGKRGKSYAPKKPPSLANILSAVNASQDDDMEGSQMSSEDDATASKEKTVARPDCVKQISNKNELANGSGAVVPKLQPLPLIPVEVSGPNSPLPMSCVTGARQGSVQDVEILVNHSPVTSPSHGSPVPAAHGPPGSAPELLVAVDVEPRQWRQQLQQRHQQQQKQIRRAPSPISMHFSPLSSVKRGPVGTVPVPTGSSGISHGSVTSSPHLIKGLPGPSVDSMTPVTSMTVPAGSKTAAIGSVPPSSPCDPVMSPKDGLVHHPVTQSWHLSHVPSSRAALAERENSEPVSVFLDSRPPHVVPSGALSGGLPSKTSSGDSLAGSGYLRRSATPRHARNPRERLNASMPPTTRYCRPGPLYPMMASTAISTSGRTTPDGRKLQ